jgi:hypothetical protein
VSEETNSEFLHFTFTHASSLRFRGSYFTGILHTFPCCSLTCLCSNFFSLFVYFVRTAGSVLGTGFQTFISDWDKVTATVSVYSSSVVS